MRLDRDAVRGPQVLEVERRHDRDDRRRRGLVAADLEVRALGADAVRVLDDARREPEHARLHRPRTGRSAPSARSAVATERQCASPERDLSRSRRSSSASTRLFLCASLRSRIGFLRAARRARRDRPSRSSPCCSRTAAARRATSVGAIGLSPAAAKRRIDRLEQLGVIVGYKAVVDHALLGQRDRGLRRAALRRARPRSTTSIAPSSTFPSSSKGSRSPATPTRSSGSASPTSTTSSGSSTGSAAVPGVTGTKTLIVLGATSGRGRAAPAQKR